MTDRTEKRVRALASFAAGIAAGTITVVGFTYRIATRAAEDVVAPVRNDLDKHLALVNADRVRMDDFAIATLQRLDALCRATPGAKCPLAGTLRP